MNFTSQDIRKARGLAAEHENETAKEYLCRVKGSTTAFGNTKDYDYWSVFTEEQQGYKNAVECIPLFPEKKTIAVEVCWWMKGVEA